MSMLSFRVNVAERIKLKGMAQAHGYQSLSKFIRITLGLKGEEPNEGGDDVPSVELLDLEHILPILVSHTDILARIDARVRRMAKQQGVDLTPGWTEEEQTSKTRKELPEGFVRGA